MCRQDQDVPVLNDEVGDVLGAKQDAIGEDGEQHHNNNEGDEDAVFAEVGDDVAERRTNLAGGRWPNRLGGTGGCVGHFAVSP
jgi:hypothetical protein